MLSVSVFFLFFFFYKYSSAVVQNKSLSVFPSIRQEQTHSSSFFGSADAGTKTCAPSLEKHHRSRTQNKLGCEIPRPTRSCLCQCFLFISQLYFLWQNCSRSVFAPDHTIHEWDHSLCGRRLFFFFFVLCTLMKRGQTKTIQVLTFLQFMLHPACEATTPEHLVKF